ncbi:MAG TPA: dihydropteroate synthase, partial [Firmicutes bacterium]|nr:dihydropteroate synthase [Bacillota bacterium]
MSTTLSRLLASHRTLVMGVVNITADSFSDGGAYLDPDAALAHARQLLEEGADILDVGGESTAPTSAGVDAEEESRRVLPVIEALAKDGVYVSVDTYKPEVARRALGAGARMVNDVTAFRGDRSLVDVVAEGDSDVCIMYAKDATPRTTRNQPVYEDVVIEIAAFLKERTEYAEKHGVNRDRIIIDPGMGAFVSGEPGPRLEILHRLREFTELGYPVLVG